MGKANPGRFFEDYRLGEVIRHATPRTVGCGERALYHALYPARHALHSSDEFARSCGLPAAPLDDLITFHIVFGKTVPDISLNAVANLGYGEGRWLRPVFPGDTLMAESEVIGLKQNSSGRSGIVWVPRSGGVGAGGHDPRACGRGGSRKPRCPRRARFHSLRFHPRGRTPPLGRLRAGREDRSHGRRDDRGGRTHDGHTPVAEHRPGAFRCPEPPRWPPPYTAAM